MAKHACDDVQHPKGFSKQFDELKRDGEVDFQFTVSTRNDQPQTPFQNHHPADFPLFSTVPTTETVLWLSSNVGINTHADHTSVTSSLIVQTPLAIYTKIFAPIGTQNTKQCYSQQKAGNGSTESQTVSRPGMVSRKTKNVLIVSAKPVVFSFKLDSKPYWVFKVDDCVSPVARNVHNITYKVEELGATKPTRQLNTLQGWISQRFFFIKPLNWVLAEQIRKVVWVVSTWKRMPSKEDRGTNVSFRK